MPKIGRTSLPSSKILHDLNGKATREKGADLAPFFVVLEF